VLVVADHRLGVWSPDGLHADAAALLVQASMQGGCVARR
jgi:hypothetical protein